MRTHLLPALVLVAISCRKVEPENTAPTAEIVSPIAGQRFDEASPVTFSGEVTDAEDALDALGIVWNSSLDGQLHSDPADGSGNTGFTTANLSVGEHLIGLTATDSGGLTADMAIAITIDHVDGAPTIEITAPASDIDARSDVDVDLEATVSDAEDPPTALLVDIESDEDGPLCSPDPDANGDVMCTETLSPGPHTLTFTVLDTSSNLASATLAIVVKDPLDIDDDGDGMTEADGDCDDTDLLIYDGASEFIDGKDQDCDGKIDDDTRAFDDDGDGVSDEDGDCDDADKLIHPGATETIDGVDQNCDGQVDEGTSAFDDDGDGYSEDLGDCDDGDTTAYPGGAEVADGADDDCDGRIDNGTSAYDADADCYCPGTVCNDSEAAVCASLGIGDCDDAKAGIRPGATEVVGNEVDEDCDGAEKCYQDADEDGARTVTVVFSTDVVCATADGEATSATALDCKDADAAVHPGATEIAGDDADQDCDGTESCYVDGDDDDYGTTTASSSDLDCNDAGEGHKAGDCDDAAKGSFPGATELIGDSIDQSCDGTEVCFEDADGDTYGSKTSVASTDTDCADPGESSNSNDCNDASLPIHPGATEVTGDDVDTDCDGKEVCYVDGDDDDFGSTTTISGDADCNDAGEGHQAGECNDTNKNINPDAVEISGDGIDQNCDGIDSCFKDNDGDGYGTNQAVVSTDNDCTDPGEAPTNDDCDDTKSAIRPNATEIAGDDIDQDCDKKESCYVDADDDDYGSSTALSSDADCNDALEGHKSGECDDLDKNVRPGATEVAGNDVDESCDGKELCYTDADDDDYGSVTVTSNDADCNDANEGHKSGECNDGSKAINPGATELTGDDIDQTCDGKEVCYTDTDDDDYGSVTVTSNDADCNDANEGHKSGECNDGSKAINPGATELTGDDVDQNCDGKEVCYTDGDDDDYGNTSVTSTDTDCNDANEGHKTTDCDDATKTVNPGAAEACNGVDDDCDTKKDDGLLGSGAACAATSCATVLADQPSAADGSYYLAKISGGTASYVCDMKNGGYTEIVNWNRETGTDSIATLPSKMTAEFNNMSEFINNVGNVEWADLNATGDVLAYRKDTDIANTGLYRADLRWTADSFEDSGLWIFATAGAQRDISCNAVTIGGAALSAAESAYIPTYTCATSNGGNMVAVNGLLTGNMGAQITSLHLRSVMYDSHGDDAFLYRMRILVK